MKVGTELRHCRVCDEAALGERGLKPMAKEVFGSGRLGGDGILRRRGPENAAELRRRWSAAMSLRALAAFGVLGDEAEILAVGPGCEEAVRWLSLRTKRVFATEPVPVGERWNPRRLVVQEMPPDQLREIVAYTRVQWSPAARAFLELLKDWDWAPAPGRRR